MKKRLLSTLLVLCMVLTLLPETVLAANTAVTDSTFPVAVQDTEENIYDTIEIYLENKSVWMKTEGLYFEKSSYRYGLFDLEGDGIPELFLSGIGGTGYYSQNFYYKVDVDTHSVYEMKDLPAGLDSIDLYFGLKIYLDNQTGQLLYYYDDFVRNGWKYNSNVFGLFYKENDVVFAKSLWTRECEVDDNYIDQYTYYYYTSGGDLVEVSEEKWEQYQENYLSQYTLIAENVPTSLAETMNSANDEVLDNIFHNLYDKLYQIKLDPIDYLAFSDLSYNESGSASIGKNVRTMIGDQWNSKWSETDILYSELYSNISPWIVYDYSSSLLTGFAAYAFKHPLLDKIVIAYRGSHELWDLKIPDWRNNGIYNATGSILDDIDWVADWILNDVKMYLGGQGGQVQNAFDFYSDIKTRSGSENISVTGHSLGGGLADIIAARYGCKGESFNSAPFLDVAYWYRYAEMSEQFTGIDEFTFLSHVNKNDIIVGNNLFEIIKPKILYAPTRKTDNHLLPSMAIKNSRGSVGLGEGKQVKALMPIQTVAGYGREVYLGTSRDDILITLLNGLSYVIYGGNGGDVILASSGSDVISGGKGNDNLDGNRGNDTYIYYRGDGHDVISDISGKDELVLYGFPRNSSITTTVVDKYIRVSVGNDVVADISMTRFHRMFSSFVVRLDGTDEALEINDLLRGKVNHAKTISISCPVNVEVIDDASGEIVYTLYDGQEETSYTQYGNFYIYSDEHGEYVKYLDLFEGYSVRIVGIGNGTMDISVQDIGDSLYDPDPFLAEDVPVTSNTIATIDENIETGEKTLLIDTNGDGTTDITYSLTEENPCAEGHHWGRAVVTAEDMLFYTCSVCGETKYEDLTPSDSKTTYTITLNTSPAGDGSIHYTVSSTSPNAKDVYIVAALYEDNGKLREIEMQPLTLTEKYTGTLPFTVDSSSLDRVKVFLLDQADYAPLCAVRDFPVPATG